MADIYVAKLRGEIRRTRSLGFCIDISALRSLIGHRELNRILNSAGMHHRSIRPPQNSFCFADAVFDSLGKISLSVMIPLASLKCGLTWILSQHDIPALLPMCVMDKESLTLCTFTNHLAKRIKCTTQEGTELFIDEWCILTHSKSNHLYAELSFPPEILFTRT